MSMTAKRRASIARSSAVSWARRSAATSSVTVMDAGFLVACLVGRLLLIIPARTVTSRTAATTITDSQAGISGAHPAPEPCSACSSSLTPMKAQMIPRPVFR